MRKGLVILAVAALGTLIVPSTGACAQGVHVDGPSVSMSGDSLQLVAHTPMGEVVALQCENHWEADATEDGHLDFYQVDLNVPPLRCPPVDDCEGAGFEGQIREDVFGFLVDIDFCIAYMFDISGSITCPITVFELHCDDVTVANQDPPPGGVVSRFEFSGELAIDGLDELEHL